MTANPFIRQTSAGQRRFRPGSWVAAVLVSAFAAWQFLGNLAGEPFFPDEQSLVAQAYYWNLYLGKAPAVPRDAWNDTDWLRYPAYDHPPLTKYLIGLGMNVGGVPVPEDLGPWFHWAQGNYARPNGLYWARLPVALCGVGACLAIFALGVLARGRLVGLTAALLLAANPLFFTLSRRAMRDVPAEAFALAAVALACWMWPRLFAPPSVGGGNRKRAWSRVLLRWLGFGASAGSLAALATLAKLTGALTLQVVEAILLLAAVCALASRLFCKASGEAEVPSGASASEATFSLVGLAAVLPALALTGAWFAAVLWLLNPFLHATPSDERITRAVQQGRLAPEEAADVRRLAGLGFGQRLLELPKFRMRWSRESLENAKFNRFDDWRLRSLGARIGAVVWQGFGRYSLFGRRRRNWTQELTDPKTGEKVELFASCLWPHRHVNGGRPGAETKRTFPCLWPAVIFFPLTLWGLACMLRDGWRAWRCGRAPVVWGVALYAGANLVSVPLYIPLAWDRYFLPVVSASALPIAYGVAALLRWFGGLFVLQPPAE